MSLLILLLLLTFLHGHVSDRRWHGHTCGISGRRTFTGTTFKKCMKSCARRAYCLAISYNRKVQRCLLHNNTDIQSDCVGHVYVKKEDFDEDVTDMCGGLGCLPDQSCNATSCIYKECQPIPHVPHSDVYGNRLRVNSKVKYVCTATDDVTIVTCQSDGQWSTLPVCLADCGDPQPIPNTTLSSGNTIEGSSRHYTCLEGYITNTGSDVIITCQANTQWTHATFQCVTDCGEPPPYPNTVISSGNTMEGSIRQYTCLNDYVMSTGSNVIAATCPTYGHWEHEDFQCLIDQSIWPYTGTCNTTATGRICQRWDSNTPHSHSYDINVFPETTLRAAENYCRDPDSSDYQWCLTTDPSKLWEACATHLCQRNCGNPYMYPNSVVTNGTFMEGSTRSYTCLDGYVISTGSDDIVTTCQANGEWDHVDFQCLLKSSIDCGIPATITNTEVSTGDTIFDSMRTYTCSPGYGTSKESDTNSMTIQCQINEQWTATNFQCLIDCGTVSITKGMSLLSAGGTLEGGQYSFSCNQGYTLYPDGTPSTITCLSNGNWEYVINSEAQCLPDTIGKSCSGAADCKEANSRCLNTGSTEFWSRCYCKPLYEYSRPIRTCTKVCSSYGMTYRLETNRIILHIIELTIKGTVEQCLDRCVGAFGDTSPSFKYNTGSGKCKCMSATVQQTRDGCPELLEHDQTLLNFYERECVP